MKKNIVITLTATVKLDANVRNSREFGFFRGFTQTAPAIIVIPTEEVLH